MVKTQTPINKMKIYGIEIDSDLTEARYPSDKVHKIKGRILYVHTCMLQKNHTILRKLQTLVGLHNFVCLFVPERHFLRYLIDLIC